VGRRLRQGEGLGRSEEKEGDEKKRYDKYTKEFMETNSLERGGEGF